jgi:hypothetical protein
MSPREEFGQAHLRQGIVMVNGARQGAVIVAPAVTSREGGDPVNAELKIGVTERQLNVR